MCFGRKSSNPAPAPQPAPPPPQIPDTPVRPIDEDVGQSKQTATEMPSTTPTTSSSTGLAIPTG